MPHPDLKDLARNLAVVPNLNLAQPIINQIRTRLRDKIDRVQPRINHNLQVFLHTFNADPYQITNLRQNRQIKVFLKRDVDIVYEFNKKTQSIYWDYPNYSTALDILRVNNGMIIENPYIALGLEKGNIAIQSWSRPKYMSKEYGKHLPTARKGKDNSRYLKGIDYSLIESILFNRGIGLMKSIDKIFFYGKFNKDIGQLPNNNIVRYVRMECVRERRPKGTGTRIALHSYPVDLSEIQRDFGNAGGKSFVTQINKNTFQI